MFSDPGNSLPTPWMWSLLLLPGWVPVSIGLILHCAYVSLKIFLVVLTVLPLLFFFFCLLSCTLSELAPCLTHFYVFFIPNGAWYIECAQWKFSIVSPLSVEIIFLAYSNWECEFYFIYNTLLITKYIYVIGKVENTMKWRKGMSSVIVCPKDYLCYYLGIYASRIWRWWWWYDEHLLSTHCVPGIVLNHSTWMFSLDPHVNTMW